MQRVSLFLHPYPSSHCPGLHFAAVLDRLAGGRTSYEAEKSKYKLYLRNKIPGISAPLPVGRSDFGIRALKRVCASCCGQGRTYECWTLLSMASQKTVATEKSFKIIGVNLRLGFCSCARRHLYRAWVNVQFVYFFCGWMPRG